MIATIIILCWLSMGLGVNIAKHGEIRYEYNAVYALIRFIIWMVLLYYAGLFNNFGR